MTEWNQKSDVYVDLRIGKNKNATPKQATPPAQQAKNPRNRSHLYLHQLYQTYFLQLTYR